MSFLHQLSRACRPRAACRASRSLSCHFSPPLSLGQSLSSQTASIRRPGQVQQAIRCASNQSQPARVAQGRKGPFSATAALLFFVAGAGMVFYFRQEKARLERRRIAERSKGVGKPKVGGEFSLLDQNGKPFTHQDLQGGFSIVYFGFTHCPDICPEELDKLAEIIDLVNTKTHSRISTSSFLAPLTSSSSSSSTDVSTTTAEEASRTLLPVFITCDPARDKIDVLKHYLAEFHADIVGLTGDWDAIRDVCKKYRVYFSTPENVKPGEDYLVDHSIYFYLMDPEGDFVEAIGRQHSAETAAKIIAEHMGDWRRR